ncbi:MAG: hypothetical protein SYR96_38745, partial [Actinomycetota bacterium]|nr:hypothetical protein [Actinomycetota bacterium]
QAQRTAQTERAGEAKRAQETERAGETGRAAQIGRAEQTERAEQAGSAESSERVGVDSIAEVERPDFAEDPTSRIVAGGGNEPNAEKRGMTVMSMERPPEDGPAVPEQRRPS